jgi:GTP-binding protein Era
MVNNNENYNFDSKRVEEAIDQEYDLTFNELKTELNQNLAITFLGTASCGKTSAIKALFDVDLGDISPIAGSTKDVKVLRISDNVYIADAPGFGDIQKEVSQKAKEICEETDIFVYIINAEGGYKEQEKRDYENLISHKENVLVVLNKIDLLRESEREIFVNDLKEKMHINDENFIVTAFDPLPQICKEPINVNEVRNWLYDRLEKKGKELLLVKILKGKDAAVDKLIWGASVSASLIGLIPGPISDIIPLTVLQIGLILRISHIYGYDISKEKTKALITATLAGQVGRTIFRQIIKLIPGFGSAVGATMAGTLTFAIGMTMKKYFKSGMSIPIEELGRIGIEYTKEAQKYKNDFKNIRKK